MKDFEFFEQLYQYLSNLPQFPQLQRYKDSSLIVSEIPKPTVLYDIYLDRLLSLLEIPRNSVSRHKELYFLYQLIRTVDPHYFTKELLSDALFQCYSLTPHQKKLLLQFLLAFFEVLVQSEFFKTGDTHVTEEELEKWQRALPEGNAWKVAEMFRDWGAGLAVSWSGYRVWHRYKHGTLPAATDDPWRWRQLCAAWADKQKESQIYPDLLAQAFSGEFSHLGIRGYCGETPDCLHCPLQTSCDWNNKAYSLVENEAVPVVIQKQKIDELSTATLAAWLFAIEQQDYEKLESQLSEKQNSTQNPLRALDQKTVYELGETLPRVELFGEKMKALLELCKRYNEEKLIPGDPFSCSADIFQHFRFQLRDLKQEVFILVLLDNKHQYLIEKIITKGTLNKSLVHPREVFSAAIENRAAAIICVHNHPSGDPKASEDDIQITRRLQEVGKIVGIPLLDHIIVGNDRHFSFADEGLL